MSNDDNDIRVFDSSDATRGRQQSPLIFFSNDCFAMKTTATSKNASATTRYRDGGGCNDGGGGFGGSCQRRLYTTHKMGSVLAYKLLKKRLSSPMRGNGATTTNSGNEVEEEGIRIVTPFAPREPGSTSYGSNGYYDELLGTTAEKCAAAADGGATRDFRHVLVFRNVYDSLASGYLYHKAGYECWLRPDGRRPRGNDKPLPSNSFPWKRNWTAYLNYDVAVEDGTGSSANDRSICQYMADEPEPAGMRAYATWVFKVKYEALLERWALSRIPSAPAGTSSPASSSPPITPALSKQIQDRTLVVCMEDLASDFNWTLEFFFPSRSSDRIRENAVPGKTAAAGQRYEGRHSTSHDPQVRQRLVEVIRQLDRDYFNGEIAWLDSVFPC